MSVNRVGRLLLILALCAGSGAALAAADLPTLLTAWLLPENSAATNPDWQDAAVNSRGVVWTTDGIVPKPKRKGDYAFPYVRAGHVIVTVHGKPTHTILGKTVEPGPWRVELLGPRGFVAVARLEMENNAQNYNTDIPAVLRKAGFSLKEYKCSKKTEPASFGNVVYRIAMAGHKSAWMQEDWSCGSAGCAQAISMIYAQQDADAAQCNAL